MNKIFYVLIACLCTLPAFGAEQPRGRTAQMAARQMTGSVRIQAGTVMPSNSAVPMDPSVTGVNPITQDKPVVAAKDTRAAEREACLNNNIGVGNTFVWASKYSDTSNYATMVEDIEEPENNVCFVKVDMKSNDSRISLSDVPSKYFEWGKKITCGSWTNENDMKNRILDAKKSARVWGTVGASVGGAALGVGAMEAFGNKLLAGAGDGKLSVLEGQKALKGDDLVVFQVNKISDQSKKTNIINQLKQLKTKCDSITSSKPEICSSDYVEAAGKLKQ